MSSPHNIKNVSTDIKELLQKHITQLHTHNIFLIFQTGHQKREQHEAIDTKTHTRTISGIIQKDKGKSSNTHHSP
jgi:type III secretory pathway lipoprotein EscJ